MARKRYAAEEIIGKLREAEVVLAQGESVAQVARRLGVAEPTYYRWRREYGGLRVDQAKRLKELERENSRLKRVVADQALDNEASVAREYIHTSEASDPLEAEWCAQAIKAAPFVFPSPVPATDFETGLGRCSGIRSPRTTAPTWSCRRAISSSSGARS